ncbi:MAG: two-component sensor histidine kinase [Planctomycetota bacterium]|jgi:two-component sensor histidine kinase
MIRFRNVSIKRKLTVIIMFSSSIALLLSCAALATYDWISSEQALTRRIGTMADIIGFNSTAALGFDNAQDAAETLSALRVEAHVIAACIYDSRKNVFAIYQRETLPFTPPQAATDGTPFIDNHLHLHRAIELDGQRIGSVYLLVDLGEIQERLGRYAGIVALAVIIASLAAFLVGSRLRDQISTPLLDLASKMRIVSSEKDYGVRAEKYREDELGELIDGFNAMLAQIQDRDEAIRYAHDELEVELVERRRIEAQISASLEEKEVLIKEIHHRVKNNLQIISSLLDLQANNIADPRTVEMFRDSQNRVTSMGLIHERLYQASDLARIDFSKYIEELSKNLLYSYSGDAANIEISTSADEIFLDVDTSIPCGLIINELISNSLKYAFPAGNGGHIGIELKKMRMPNSCSSYAIMESACQRAWTSA